MKVNETIRLLEWENERGSDEMERIRKECEFLHEQIAGLANDVGAVNPYDIEEDDIVF